MIARLYLWYADHPRLGRPALVAAVVQALALAAVCTAPRGRRRPPT